MSDLYQQMWQLAKPYYLKGRPMDIDHIEWMMQDTKHVCDQEDLDDTLLMPLVILHDVGYAHVPQDNPFNLDMRKAHMEEGSKIARDILEQLNYSPDKTDKVTKYISIHDNWAFGDDHLYHHDKTLGTFNDLDYMWMATPKGFPALMKILNKDHQQMLDHLESNDKPVKRPFSTPTTKQLYETYLNDRKAEPRLTQKQI